MKLFEALVTIISPCLSFKFETIFSGFIKTYQEVEGCKLGVVDTGWEVAVGMRQQEVVEPLQSGTMRVVAQLWSVEDRGKRGGH